MRDESEALVLAAYLADGYRAALAFIRAHREGRQSDCDLILNGVYTDFGLERTSFMWAMAELAVRFAPEDVLAERLEWITRLEVEGELANRFRKDD